MRFVRAPVGDSLLLLWQGKAAVALAYVDDILVLEDTIEIEKMMDRLHKMFRATDLGRPAHFHGLKADFQSDENVASQSAYILVAFEMAGLCDINAARDVLSMSDGSYEELINPSPEDMGLMNKNPFRVILGAVLFLSTPARLEISTTSFMIAKLKSKRKLIHCKLITSVVHYLTGMKDHRIY